MTGLGKNNLLKRIAAFVLAVLMVFTMIPFGTSVAKAEDGAGEGDGSGTNSSVTYTFDVYEMIDGTKTGIGEATVSIYAEGYDGTDVSATPIATGVTSAEADTLGTVPIELTGYASTETTQNLVYEVTYTKEETDSESNVISTIYTTKRGILGTDTTTPISVELKQAKGFSGTIYLGSDTSTPATTSFDIQLLDAGNAVIASTKSRTDGTYMFDEVAAGTYTISVQATDDYTPVSCKLSDVTFDEASESIVVDQNIHLVEKQTVSMTFNELETILVYGTADYIQTAQTVDYTLADGTIQYSSNNETVVSVDASTGVLTTNGVGTATITATLVDDNAKGSVSYTVTVTGFSISGKVTDADSAPIAGETIYLLNDTVSVEDLKNTDLSTVETTVTGEDGTYTFTNLVPGGYTVAVYSENYKPITLDVTLGNANSETNDLTLTVKEEVTLNVSFAVSTVELLTNKSLDSQEFENLLTISKDGTILTETELQDYNIVYSVDSESVIKMDSTGTITEIVAPGTATISVSITSDEYKVNTGISDLQYIVKVWTLAFVDEALTDTVEKTYGDAAFSTKAILKGAGEETKVVSVTYGSSMPTIANLVYVDANGNEVEQIETAADVKVELVAASDNSTTITATYGDVKISYDVKVNKITSVDGFVWSGYDESTDVVDDKIVINYVYGGATKTIAVSSIANVKYTSSNPEIVEVDPATGAISAIKGVGENITITAEITGDNYDVEPITYTINVGKGELPDFAWAEEELIAVDNLEKYTVTDVETGKQIETTYEKDIKGFGITAQSNGSGTINYVYTSSHENVATVEQTTGDITIVGAGTTTITCAATSDFYETKEITYVVKVNPAEQKITWEPIDWTPSDFVLLDGGEITLEYKNGLSYQVGIVGQIEDSNLTYGFNTEAIEGYTNVATVDNTGIVTVQNAGEICIIYESYDADNIDRYKDVRITYKLIVERGKENLAWDTTHMAALDEIAVLTNAEGTEVSTLPTTGGTATIVYDKSKISYQLDVTGKNTDLLYEFSVSGNDDNVITLNSTTGEVTINKAGTVVITYKATNATSNYEVSEVSYTLVIQENPQSELTWDSSNVDIKKVDISQLSANKVSLTYAPDFTEFKIGVSGQIEDSKLTKKFESSDTSVATVGTDGTITILRSGTTIITYTSTDTTGCYAEKTLTYELTIKKAEQNGFVWNNNVADGSTITITYDKDNMDRVAQLTTTVPVENAVVTYAVTSGDAVVITDASTGAITVNKSGNVTITASIPATTNYNEKTLTYTLVVNKDNQTVHFDNTTPSFTNGGATLEFIQPELILDEEEGSDTAVVKYSIVSDPNKVISEIEESTGVIQFSLQPGVVVVKATREADDKYNEASATYTLTVNEWDPLSTGASSTYYQITGTKIDYSTVWYTKVDDNNPIKLIATDAYQLYVGTTDPTPTSKWSSSIDITKVQDGINNPITYYIKEKATGYVSKENPLNFFVDRIAPNASIVVDEATIWEKLLSFFTFDIAGQDVPELVITTSDAHSDIESVQYFISNGVVPMTKNGVLDTSTLESVATWTTYSGVVDLLSKNVAENVIYTKVIDKAGHVTYAHTNGLIFDGAKPVVTPTIVTKDSNGIYYGNVEINLNVTDAAPYSGIQQITYKVENAGTVTDSGTLFTFQPAQAGNPKQSELVSAWNSANYGKDVVVKATDNNSDNVKVTFTVVDNAGNTTETVVNLKIDITAPVISVQYDNNAGDTTFANGVYYNANRTATITVKERHFDANNVKLKITNTDGVIPTLSGWTKIASGTGNEDDTTYQTTVVFAADGDYTFDVSCVDAATNASGAVNYGTSQAPTAFTIDKTAPIISVSYNNNDALNENYFKADRTATIVIQEHNFEASRVNALITATDDGQTIGAPSISGWSSSGDTHTATITYSSDALYTFDIEYADKAGNTIADFAPQTFYVDKTTPQLSITEIVDLSANNEERIGFVITATDTNFDVFTPVLTAVIQTENGFTTTELDVASISEITNGQVYTVDNLDTDGIYSITCTVVDKAGNAYTEVNLQREDGSTYVENRAGEDTLIMFSVNRAGSVFDVDDNTKDILDKYYVQSVENDVVIYEVNTNELATYSISLNGEELTEGTDYTVNSTGGNGEWMRYTYTVNKSLFEGEGEYVLVVSSTDDAENNAFSDVKNANISFVVDRTAPVVTVTGMESDRSYQTDRQIVTLMPTDDGGTIETLIVRLVDRDGNVLEELLNMSGEELRELLDTNGGTITFEISEGLNQNIQIICGDGSYNAEGQANTFNQTYENVSVSASAVAIFFAGNTIAYIGGGVALTGAAVCGGIFFFRKRKMPKTK